MHFYLELGYPQFTLAENGETASVNEAWLQLPTDMIKDSSVAVEFIKTEDEGDVNGDGTINITDVMLLLKKAMDN